MYNDFLALMRRSRHAMREQDGAGAGAAAPAETPAETPAEPPSFDELIKSNKAYQRELDKRVTGAINTAKTKWEADAKAKADEAARLAQMSAEEKAAAEREAAIKALDEREAAITKRELKAEAKSQLAEKGLPAELAEMLDYTSADTCKSTMESVSSAFSKAVESAVKERLKGSAPKAGSKNTPGFAEMSVQDKMRYANEHPNDPEVAKYLGKK